MVSAAPHLLKSRQALAYGVAPAVGALAFDILSYKAGHWPDPVGPGVISALVIATLLVSYIAAVMAAGLALMARQSGLDVRRWRAILLLGAIAVAPILHAGIALLAGAIGGAVFWGMTETRRRPLLVSWVVLALGFAVLGIWYAGLPSEKMSVSSAYDWQSASAKDCALMAQTLQQIEEVRSSPPPPLFAPEPGPGPCDWSRGGLKLTILTPAEFSAARHGLTGPYIAHLVVGRPRYAWFGHVAEVWDGYAYGELGARGNTCYFRRALGGWTLWKCRQSWTA